MVDLSKSVHSSLHNYQQIHLNDTTITNAGTRTIAHGLGYIPYVRLWVEHIAGEVSAVVVPAASTTYHADYATAPITETSLTSDDLLIESSVAGQTVYYRIYIDRAS